MRLSSRDVLVRGAAGGLVAGAVVALWFLAVDLVAGAPLRTPDILARTLFERPEATAGPGLVASYTLLHFGAFAALGVLAAWFLAVTDAKPGWLAGLLFGICVLNAVHYASLLATGSGAIAVLPWHHVVGANLAAGLGLMAFLHRTTRDPRPLGPAMLKSHPVAAEGLVTGLLGAGVVALWFFLLDIVAGQPFRTPAALGSALFLGAGSPAEVELNVGIVAAYTVVHVAAFWAVGALFVAVARQLERAPPLTYLVVLAFIVVEAVSFGALVSLGEWIVGALSVWAIGIGNLLGVGAMAWWVWKQHPVLRRRVLEEGFSSAA